MATFISSFDPYDTATVQQHGFGQKIEDKYGDVYRFIKASAAISSGKLQQSPSPKTNHHNVAASAASIGDTKLTVTLGATAATANEYAFGKIVANDVGSEGVSYRVASHPAADSAGTLEITLERPLVEAVAASDEFTLVHNPHNGTQESTTQTLTPVGVPLVDIASGSFGWVLTKGVTAVLADETLTVGEPVVPGSSTAGAVELEDWQLQATDASRTIAERRVGWATVAGVDTEFRPVQLDISN